jgi:hypothetical protein
MKNVHPEPHLIVAMDAVLGSAYSDPGNDSMPTH